MRNKWKLILPICIVAVGTLILCLYEKKEVITYKETVASRGDLTVGVSKSGSVNIGTITQTFDLDMSALLRVETSNTSSESVSAVTPAAGFEATSGSGNSFAFGEGLGQVFSMNAGNITTAGQSNSKLIVSEICVSVGRTVQKGDVLYRLEEAGVTDLTEELKSNVEKAEADLNALKADQEISRLSAQTKYEIAKTYESYAETEKNNTIQSLTDTLQSEKQGLESAKKLATVYEERLEQAKTELATAEKSYEGVVWSRDSQDRRNNTELYVRYAREVENAAKLVDTMEQTVNQYETKLAQAKNTILDYENRISKASRQLELGQISAEETYELRILAYENAQETYDVALAYLDEDLNKQQKIYDEAEEKWNSFVSYIDGVEVKAKYDGVITSVDLNIGDSLSTNAKVVTLYDTSEVTMTVTLEEDEMADIRLGTEANVSLIAYPEKVLKAVVTEISDATTDSSGNTTQDVTVTFAADISGVYHGMTGEITFLTRNLENVVYVSNRAILRKGTESYVKVKDMSGNTRTAKVETGFSDGGNVEIKEGLSEGDVVLVESKVSKE